MFAAPLHKSVADHTAATYVCSGLGMAYVHIKNTMLSELLPLWSQASVQAPVHPLRIMRPIGV